MADTRRDRTGEMVSMLPQSTSCDECTADDPQIRARHHLGLAKQGGLDLLKPHLYRHYAQSPRITTEQRREAVESLCGWVAGLMTQWSGFADDTTGAPLPWWEARRQMAGRTQAIAQAAQARVPERGSLAAPATIEGFSRVVPSPAATYLREPGEDPLDEAAAD